LIHRLLVNLFQSCFNRPAESGERFRAYIEQFLVPTLKPGDVVILDNLGSHKGKVVRQAVRAAGARLVFLPKYSPDLNPIEQVFAKFKTLLRRAGTRTYDAVADASATALGLTLRVLPRARGGNGTRISVA